MGKYSDETRAAVIAALLAGQSVSQVAEQYKIPRGTIAGWSAKANDSELKNVSNTKKTEIGDLLIEYLRENLTTLRAQVVIFRNEDWLSRQDASAAAILHGVLTDKAVRLLEAMSNAAGDTDS